MKQRVKVVVLENENLRDELKGESVQESLSDHAENYVLVTAYSFSFFPRSYTVLFYITQMCVNCPES